MTPLEQARMRMGLGDHLFPPQADSRPLHTEVVSYYAPCPCCVSLTLWRGELLRSGISRSKPVGNCC
jgi:hypothetical protein